jgi:hypothetical protein
LSDEYFLAESNSRRQLPEKLRIENFKPEETLLDKTVAKFSESVNGPLSQNILIQQDVYNDAHTKNAVRARSKNNLLVKEVLGGKLLSIPVLDAMRTNINDLLGDDYLEDNNDLIDHLAQINTLERFLSPVNLPTDFDFSNPEDVEKIKIGLIQIFEDGIREAFKNSPQQNLVESMLSVLQNAVADFLQENDFDTDDGLETFVAYILGHMEDFGNLVFLQTYEETKRILPTKNTPRK